MKVDMSLVAQSVKSLPAAQETQVQSLGWEDPWEKEMATHSSIIACRIPWTEEPGRIQSMGSKESDTTSWLNQNPVLLTIQRGSWVWNTKWLGGEGRALEMVPLRERKMNVCSVWNSGWEGCAKIQRQVKRVCLFKEIKKEEGCRLMRQETTESDFL